MHVQSNVHEFKKIPKLRFAEFSNLWEEQKLGKILKVERGGSPRPIESFITKNDDGIPWIKIGDLKTGSRFVTNTGEKIKPEGVKNSREVYPGDFILSNSMSFGRPYIVKIHGCIHDGWLALRNVEKDKVTDDFLYVLLQTETIRRKFLSLAAGSAVRNLKSGTVQDTIISLPTILEQQKIASFLSSVDEWVENLRLQKATLEKYKKGIMQKLFSQQIRFKDENGKDFPEWDENLLGEITYNFDNLRKPISSVKRIGGIYPYYGANGVTDFVDGYIFEGEYILVAEDGVVDVNDYPIHIAKGKFWVNNHAHVIQGKNINNLFLYYLLLNTKFSRYITGSAQTKLNGQVLSKIKVSVPNITEQQKIAAFLNSIDDLLSFKVNQIKLAENWKKGLMQNMFI